MIFFYLLGLGDSSKSSWQDTFAGFNQQIKQVIEIIEDTSESQESDESCIPQRENKVWCQKEFGYSIEGYGYSSEKTIDFDN